MASVVVTLFGGFQARVEPGGAVTLPTRKAQALLAYLALAPGRAHPREKLAALLWGGIRQESARASLRQALFAIRRALDGTGALRQQGDTVALDRTVAAVDVAAFEHAVRDGTPEALERAAALYTGDLLTGLVIDEPAFEEWLLGERERLRELSLDGLAKLLAHQRRAGALAAAVATALRMLSLDPLQEAVHRMLMRGYADLGRRGTALRQYQHCVGLLGRELGIEPEPETKALYQEILRQRALPAGVGGGVAAGACGPGPLGGSRAPVAEIPLVGRPDELEQLRAALERARAGRGGVVAVLGEAGIGKTRLVGELIGVAEQAGTRVLLGRSYESEQVLPFGPWVDAFRAAPAADDLASVGPDWGGPDFLKVFESVSAALGGLARQRPLLVVLEDLHWADEMSVRLLAFLGRRVPVLSALVILTTREEELADAGMLRRVLDELQREHRLWPLRLAGLSRDDTLTLVQTLARSGTDETALARLAVAAWNASAGNPFVVVETVRSQAQGVGQLAEPVRQLVTSRLDRLSERGRLLTTVAAVIGREFEFTLLRRAAGVGEAEAAESMEELVRRRVLHGVGERFDFTHDRVREVARAGLLAPRRRVLHRRVAEAIEAIYADDLEPHVLALGLHYHGAEMWPEALRYLRRAGAHASAQSAYREAATCFEQALGAASHLPRTPAMLRETLELQLQLRNALWPLAEFDRIAACLAEADGLAVALEDQGRLGRIAAFLSVLHWVTGDAARARSFAERARDVADTLDDRPLSVMANYYLGLARYLLADYPGAEAAFLDNVGTLTGAREPDPLGAPGSTLVRSAAWLVLPLAERGVFDAGLTHGRAALELAEATQDPYGVVSAGYCLAYLHCLKGELDVAVPLLERGLALCRARDFGVWLPQVTGYLGYAYARVGRVDEGLALLERAIDIYDATRAWPFRALLTAHRGTACLLAGRLDAARALADEALVLARQHGERGYEAWSLRLLGDVASRGDGPDAREADRYYREARTLANELGMRPLVAHCHLALGTLVAGSDHVTQRDHLTTAAAMYRDMDMDAWRAQAEAALTPPTR